MPRLKSILASLALAVASLATAAPPTVAWEQIKEKVTNARTVAADNDVIVLASSQAIVISTQRTIQVKVFTILGRLVSSETLQPGTSRLSLGTHGVYIVTIGETTCKVAV